MRTTLSVAEHLTVFGATYDLSLVESRCNSCLILYILR